MNARGACCDGPEHHIASRQREVIGMVFANPKEIQTDLVGQHPFFDDVADGLRVREWAILLVVRDIAEGVEAEGQWERYGCSTRWYSCHVDTLLLDMGSRANRDFTTLPRRGPPVQTRFGATIPRRPGLLVRAGDPRSDGPAAPRRTRCAR